MINIETIAKRDISNLEAIKEISTLMKDKTLDAKDRGKLAELGTLYLLKIIQNRNSNMASAIFTNNLFETHSGTTEIDSILVTSKAIFVVETKSYYGETTITDNDDQTFVTTTGKGKVRKTTPIKQNIYHTKVLKDMLYGYYISDLAFIPIVNVFSSGKLIDNREKSLRNQYPVTNLKYLGNVIETVLKNELNTRINFKGCCEIIKSNNIYNKQNMNSHIKRVSSRGGK